MPDEPPNEPQVELRDPTGIQVEPGGETSVEQDGSVAHEDADARADGMAEEANGGVQDEAERLATCQNALIEGERGSALAQGRSTTADEPTDQWTSTIVDNVAEDPPVPPPPLERPPNAENEPPSVELEGERKSLGSCEVGPTSAETTASGVSRRDEDPRNRPKAAQNTSEQVQEHSKQSS